MATANVSDITGEDQYRPRNGRRAGQYKTMYKQATASVEALHSDADALKHNFLLRGYFKKQGFADPDEIQKYLIPRLPPEPPEKTFRSMPARCSIKTRRR